MNADMGALAWRIRLYNLLLVLILAAAFPWVLFQLLFVPRRRKGLAQRFGSSPVVAPGSIWVHAVSVGEVRAVLPMVPLFLQSAGDRTLVLSTVTPTGQETARRECNGPQAIFYFPMDFPGAVSRALDRVQPSIFVTAETEFWPNFLFACFRRRIPVAVVNGRISDRSLERYLKYRWFFAPLLARVSLFLMQSEEDARRIVRMGAPASRVQVTGNTKYDRRPKPVTLPPGVAEWGAAAPAGGRGPPAPPLLVAGSTHAGEETAILSAAAEPALSSLRAAVVPRHPERFDEVAQLLETSGIPWFRFSSILKGQEVPGAARIILVDAMGVLDGFYALADAAFVGGSLVPVGGHNLLEPAMHAVPVLTGPHLQNFRDISQSLVSAGACLVVADARGLAEALGMLISDAPARKRMGEAARRASDLATGASSVNVARIMGLLEVHT